MNFSTPREQGLGQGTIARVNRTLSVSYLNEQNIIELLTE